MSSLPRNLFRVRFLDQAEKKSVEVIVETVSPSEILGLVTLQGFVFRDNTKHVILPEEDAARSRFGKTNRLHIPYHSIIYLEEFTEEPVDLKHLPFIKSVQLVEEKATKDRSPLS